LVGGKGKLTAARIAFKLEGSSIRRFIPTNEVMQLKEAVTRAIARGVLAVVIAIAARRARSLTTSGAVAAAIVGAVAIGAGWSWGLLLISFFASSSALSRLGSRRKAELVGSVSQKGGERDAMQVLSNGGLFAASALGYLLLPSPL